MAAGSLGAAAVEIIAETDQFDDELRRSLQEAADDAADRIGRNLQEIRRDAERTGQRLGEALGEGSDEAARHIERMGRLARDAENALDSLDADSLDRIGREASEAADDLDELARAARAGEGAFEGLDDEELERIGQEAAEAARDMRRLARESEDAAREIRRFTDIDSLRRMARDIERARREAERLNSTRLQNLGREAGRAGAAIRRAFRDGADGAQDDLDRIDNVQFRRLVQAGVRAADRVGRAFRGIRDNIDFSERLNRLQRTVRNLITSVGRLVLVVQQLAGAFSAVAATGVALAPTFEIIAAAPAALLLGVAAAGTLALALRGVGEAFSAALGDDAAKFEKALEGLSPQARKVAKELRGLKPAFDDLRRTVQDAFFRPLVGQLAAVGRNLAGPVKRGATGVASEFGRLGRAVTDFGKSAEAVRLVDGVFGTLRKQLQGIRSETVTGLLDAFSRFTRATLPGFDGLGNAIDSSLGRLTRFLDRAAEGGDALRWVKEGTAAVKQLGSLLADIGGIVAGVFRAIREASGGETLGNFAALADGLHEFVDSAEGSQQLVEVFRGINEVGAQSLPVIKALVGGLAALAPTVAEISTDLGPALVAAIGAAVPALQGIGDGLVVVFDRIRQAVQQLEASGALGALGRGLGALLKAASPLITAIGDLLVPTLRSLAVAAQVLAPILSVVARAIAAVADSPLAILLGPLIAQLILVRLVTGRWALALRSLVPVLKLVGKAAKAMGAALVRALVANPITAAIVAVAAAALFVATRFEGVRKKLRELRDALGRGLERLKEFGSSLLTTFRTEGAVAALKQLGNAILTGLSNAARAAAQAAPRILAAILNAILSALVAIPGLMGRLATAIANGLSAAAAAIPRVASQIAENLRRAFSRIREEAPRIAAALRTALSSAFAQLRTQGPKIASALFGLLRSAFRFVVERGPGLVRQGFAFLRDIAGTVLTNLAAGIRRVGDGITKNVPALAQKISDFLRRAIQTAARVIPEILNGLTAKLQGGFDKSLSQAAGGDGSGKGGTTVKQTLINLLIEVIAAVIEQLPTLLKTMSGAIGKIALTLIEELAKATPQISAAVLRLLIAIGQQVGQQLGAFLATLPLKILTALAGLGGALAGLAQRAMFAFLRGIVTVAGTIIGFFLSLPIRIVAALARLGMLLGQLAVRAMNAFRNFFSRGGESTAQSFQRLPGRIASALASLPGRLGAAAARGMTRLQASFTSGGNRAVSFFKRLGSRFKEALSALGNQLYSVGRDLMQGLINGAKSLASSFVDAVTAPVRNAISAAKSILGSNSPSRVFAEIGRDVGRGFVKGVTGEKDKIASTFADLIADITKAFKGKATKIDDILIARIRAANKRLQALATQRDKIAEKIRQANEKVAEIAQAAREFASIGSVAAALGDTPATAANLAAGLRERLAKIQKFQADLAKLAKRGAGKSLIDQLTGLGVEQGGALADALSKATDAEIKDLKTLTDDIAKASTDLGKQTADLLFDSGKRAGEGFLAGLKAQQKEIIALMTKIAEQVAKTVKKTLKIKSPSRVMAGLGGDTIAGFVAGLERLGPDVEKVLERILSGEVSLKDLNIPSFGNGGIVNSSTLARVGESGGEAIVPVDRPKRAAEILSEAGLLDKLSQPTNVTNVTNNVDAPVTVQAAADPSATGSLVSRRIAQRVRGA